ncbi:MAG: FAD-binding protein, partial [Thermoanaerobaculia bacterium]
MEETREQGVSRRGFLRAGLAAVAVAGFDVHFRSWVTAAEFAGRSGLAEDFPRFDGELLTDEASLAAAADDFGHHVHRRPMAVLRPGSVRDIVRLIDFARAQDIEVAARGQGHSTLGQAQVEAGVVIDMSTLAAIYEIDEHSALVGAGLRWSDLLRQTIPLGLAPPTLTDYI